MKFSSTINKKFFLFISSIGISASAFAYNPPVQGENLTGFINPHKMIPV